MKLLLDTHVWLWALLEPLRLAPNIVRAIEEPSTDLWLSPISVWEALLLIEAGRLTSGPDPNAWLAQAAAELPVRDAILTREVARLSRGLSLPQQDPADRFIAATAQTYGLTLVTADQQLLASNDIETLGAR